MDDRGFNESEEDTVATALLDEQETILAVAEEAIESGNSALLDQCMRRLDPCGVVSKGLCERARAAGLADPRRTRSSENLPEDPPEVVAKAFLEGLSPEVLFHGLSRHGWWSLVVLGVMVILGSISTTVGELLPMMALPAFLVLLSAEATAFAEGLWQGSGRGARGPASLVFTDRQVLLASIAGLLSLAVPVVLGFSAGVTWSLLLSFPMSVAGILVLVSPRLHRIHPEFPFGYALHARELLAMSLAGLLSCAGAVLAAFLAFTGLWFGIPALIVIDLTWSFAIRASMLLARRIHYRLQSEELRAEPVPELASLRSPGFPSLE